MVILQPQGMLRRVYRTVSDLYASTTSAQLLKTR